VENLYVRRRVTVLAVHEHELADITFMNTLAIASFSVASGFTTFAGGIYTSALFAERPTALAMAAIQVGAPACLVAAAMFAVLGLSALVRKRRTLVQILEQTTESDRSLTKQEPGAGRPAPGSLVSAIEETSGASSAHLAGSG
jgi:hypothetical protein